MDPETSPRPECPECGDPVDEDGASKIECWGSGGKCDECFGCYCDGSC